MLLFIPRSLCALKRVAAKAEHARYGATQGIRITLASGPDDACEAVVLPKDLERACKVGDQFVQSQFDMVGMATSGADIYLGLGNDVINTRTVEGRFPMIDNVMPKKRPMFTFRIDPKLMAETLLAMADLLPDTDRGVQCFYYGDGYPLGFCAQNPDNGMMIDALVVPLSLPQEPEKPQNGQAEPEGEQPEAEQAEATDTEPKPKRRGRKLAIAQPEGDGEQDAPPAAQADGGQDAPPAEQPEQSNGKRRKKTKKVAV